MSAADSICVLFQCHSTTTLLSITAEANTYSHSVPWTRELTDSTVMATQTDHRNQQKVLLPAFCLYAWKEKSSELSITLSEGRGRPTSCPGQHDAPVQKLNARPALPSSSPTVDFPPLYPTWASKPAQQHTHKVKLCLISSAATNLICTKWRNCSCFWWWQLWFEWMWTIAYINEETMKGKIMENE